MIGSFLSSKFSGYLAIAGIIAVLGLVWYIYNEGKQACISDTINLEVQLMEKRNEIANNRPDVGIVLNRLRDGSF